jgi:tRNA (guanosine-2'-O-)-methyltransferase
VRRHPDELDPLVRQPLPASAEHVLEALEPMISSERRARIGSVVAARTRAVVPVLDGLIDPHNIAAVLRSADAFGVHEVHVIERDTTFMATRRIAQGTERWIDVVRHVSPEACVAALRARGHRVYVAAMDGTLGPSDLRQLPRVAVVFGNEHLGVSDAMRKLADGTYTIPMLGFVQSLNVSVAAAITLFAARGDRPGDLEPQDQCELRARFVMQSVPRADEVVREHLRRRGA